MIEAIGVKKSFGPRAILRGIDLKVETGETLVIIGGSGCGKSTFLKCVIGLHAPDSGKIIVDGHDITKLHTEGEIAEYRRRFGYLFQEGALFDSMTVAENICFGLRYLTDIPKAKYRQIASDSLALVGLKDVEDFKPSELSGGMKKRVAAARCLVMDPEILLFDEPTTGLDPVTANSIYSIIKKLNRERKMTSFIISHEIPEIFDVADRAAMIHDGKIAAFGSSQEIRNSANPIVQHFLKGEAD
jgi:phospholipid/cholesterol/gamma-HCH transport system ATP-binding protein